MSVLDFTPVPVPYLEPVTLGAGVEAYRPDVPDFELVHVTGDSQLELEASAIAVCTAGQFEITGSADTVALGLGEAVFLSGETALRIAGAGDLFIATSGQR